MAWFGLVASDSLLCMAVVVLVAVVGQCLHVVVVVVPVVHLLVGFLAGQCPARIGPTVPG